MLFLRGSRDVKPTHSFPTRRSSDLFDFVGRSETHVGRFAGVDVADDRLHERAQVAGRAVLDFEHNCRDRKSTRLNSSHVAISYAVFCLKKKKATGEVDAIWAEAAMA